MDADVIPLGARNDLEHDCPVVPADELSTVLARLRHQIDRRQLPVSSQLRPGLAVDVIHERCRKVGMPTHPDLITWWAWHDGVTDDAIGFFPGHYTWALYHMSLSHAIAWWQREQEEQEWDEGDLIGTPDRFVPVLSADNPTYVVDSDDGRVGLWRPDSSDGVGWLWWPNLATAINSLVIVLAEGYGWSPQYPGVHTPDPDLIGDE